MWAPPTAEQIEMLLSFLQEHQDLARGHQRDVSGRARTRELMARSCKQLECLWWYCENSKTVAGPRPKVWADRKYLAKRAASAARQSATATGGRPSNAPPISENDRRIISIMGEGFGSQQVEGILFSEEPASATSASTAAPPYGMASQDDILLAPLDPSVDEERLGELALSALPPQASQPAASSSQNQPRAQPARTILRARRGLSGSSLGSRIIALEEQRLNTEQRRAATEERLIAIIESIMTELQQLRLEIMEVTRQLLSRQQ